MEKHNYFEKGYNLQGRYNVYVVITLKDFALHKYANDFCKESIIIFDNTKISRHLYRLITKWESRSMFLTKKWYCLSSAVLSDVSYYWAGWNKKRSKSQTSSDDDLQSMMNEQHLLLSSRNTSIVLRKIAVATPRLCKVDPTDLYLHIPYLII